MGAKLCCLNHPNSEPQQPKKITPTNSKQNNENTNPLQIHKALQIFFSVSNINANYDGVVPSGEVQVNIIFNSPIKSFEEYD